MSLEYRFRTIDFRPAPEGWRILWITRDGLEVTPMPGWFVREEFEYDSPNSSDARRSTGSRDVIAGHVEDHAVEPLDLSTHTGFWLILGPGDPEPNEDEIALETSRRYADGILETRSTSIPCPACEKEAQYARELDLYVHLDGSENRPCWLAAARGQVALPTKPAND